MERLNFEDLISEHPRRIVGLRGIKPLFDRAGEMAVRLLERPGARIEDSRSGVHSNAPAEEKAAEATSAPAVGFASVWGSEASGNCSGKPSGAMARWLWSRLMARRHVM